MSDTNVLGRMFEWWNDAYTSSSGFTPQAFGAYFTADATLTVNGALRGRGLAALAQHFVGIKASTTHVVIERPAVAEFVSADGRHACSHHFVSATLGGKRGRERVMAVATLHEGKIATLDVVGVEATPTDS